MISIESNVRDLFQVFFGYGLAAILEEIEKTPAFIWWDQDGLVNIKCADAVIQDAAQYVKEHAENNLQKSWLTARTLIGGKKRATLSPRIGRLDSDAFEGLQRDRWNTIDTIPIADVSIWHLIGALGEPAYWAQEKNDRRPDYGASPWEMKTRNRGEEFIQNRVAILARKVAERKACKVKTGLSGASLVDEAGKNSLDSRTPTGLRAPGLTDNAQAWCALVGIGFFPTCPVAPTASLRFPRSAAAGVQYGTWKGKKTTFLYAPIPTQPATLSRLRCVLRSESLARFVKYSLMQQEGSLFHDPRESRTSSSGNWLANHGIGGVMISRKHFTDNPNAPESWAIPIAFETT